MIRLPSVLVIIPAYNASLFLKESINSVLKQRGVNLKIVVIDDASDDDTYKIAKGFSTIEVIKNNVNMGNYYSVNYALHLLTSSGVNWDYHVFHGADDISHSDRFIKQIRKFEESANILAVGCRFQRMDYKTKKIFKTNPETNESMLIFKKEVFDIIGYRDSGRAGCDTEYKKRLLLCRPGSISSVNEILLTAYLHSNNLTKKIPIGGDYRKKYVNQFRVKHEHMKKTKNYYQDFNP
jgi:glycosyltransferase involved in cell wall biosynthesis